MFFYKARYKKEDLKFIIIGDNKVKMESTIEENGICNDKSYYILVKKKTENDIMEEKKENDEYEYEKEKDKDIEIENYNYNSEILGEKIKIFFQNLDEMVEIEIGKNNTIKDAVIKFGQKRKIATSKIISNYIFLFNYKSLDLKSKKTLKEIGLNNGSRIFAASSETLVGA